SAHGLRSDSRPRVREEAQTVTRRTGRLSAAVVRRVPRKGAVCAAGDRRRLDADLLSLAQAANLPACPQYHGPTGGPSLLVDSHTPSERRGDGAAGLQPRLRRSVGTPPGVAATLAQRARGGQHDGPPSGVRLRQPAIIVRRRALLTAEG